jgi:hypothetical protein
MVEPLSSRRTRIDPGSDRASLATPRYKPAFVTNFVFR